MTWDSLPRLRLARTPTPLDPLSRTGRAFGLDLYVKRDDLTGAALSGNKVRKLEFLLADAEAQRATTIITCGGVNSNHARATAVAAAERGLKSHLVLRGEDRNPPIGNLLLDRWVGARISFITSDQWRDRDAIMEAHRRDYASRDERAYVVPEGGSNALGAIGYAMAAKELVADEASRGIRIAHVVHATGSGGTTAGLALGFAMLGREDVDVCAIAVCDDAPYFDARIRSILDEAVDRKLVTRADADRARWRVVEGYKGTGYAQTTPEEMRAQRGLAMRDGIIVDPVYTGKAYLGLLGEATASRLSGATVFLHTGGIFELFAYASEIGRLAKAQ